MKRRGLWLGLAAAVLFFLGVFLYPRPLVTEGSFDGTGDVSILKVTWGVETSETGQPAPELTSEKRTLAPGETGYEQLKRLLLEGRCRLAPENLVWGYAVEDAKVSYTVFLPGGGSVQIFDTGLMYWGETERYGRLTGDHPAFLAGLEAAFTAGAPA